MASAQTLPFPPQVGFQMGRAPSPVSLPFSSIRIIGCKKDLAWKGHRSSAFWSDVLAAEVDGKMLLAKVYTQAIGGEKAFEHDLEVLQREHNASTPRVYGLSDDSTTPCILFSIASLTPFCDYISRVVARSQGDALLRVWQLLIDMRDAAALIVKKHSSVGATAIKDAISKAHIDDRDNVVITPEYGECKAPYQGSVDEAVRFSWAAVLQRDNLRPLRSLGYALDGNASTVLSTSPKEFGDLESAEKFLCRSWLPQSQRYLNWPQHLRGPYVPGDVGVFVKDATGTTVFRKLCSIASDLSGVDTLFSVCDFDQVQTGVYRITCHPFDSTSSDSTSEPFMLSWFNLLKDRDNQAAFLLANAKRLGAEHGVSPEALVLVTKTAHGMDGQLSEELARSIKAPLHFYVHLDRNGVPSKQYWSFDNRLQADSLISPDISSLPLPTIEMHFGPIPFPTRYIQVERTELERA